MGHQFQQSHEIPLVLVLINAHHTMRSHNRYILNHYSLSDSTLRTINILYK